MKVNKEGKYFGYTKTGYLAYHTDRAYEAIEQGNIKLAKKIYNQIVEVCPSDDRVNLIGFKIHFIENNIEQCKIDLDKMNSWDVYFLSVTGFYIHINDTKMMEKLYFAYFYNQDENPEVENTLIYKTFYRMKAYLQKQLNVYDNLDLLDSYSVKQESYYDRESAIAHVIHRHGIDTDYDKTRFNEDININDLFDKVELLINQYEDRKKMQNLQNFYVIKWNNIGYDVDGKVLNHMVVGVTYGINNIVTMYPCKELSCYNNVIDAKELYNSKSKIKKISQIDKFRQKYGK